MQITAQLTGSRVTLYLIFISLISLGLALFTIDFSIPPHADDIGYVLTAIQYNEGDFFLHQKKHPGWSLVITPFISIIDSDNFLDYTNLVRGLSLIISTASKTSERSGFKCSSIGVPTVNIIVSDFLIGL